jgi:hypothetical protein
MLGPLGNYGIAQSLVQTPGWKALEAEQNEMLPGDGGGGGGFGMSFGGRGMTDEEKVRAYGYEGGLSPMQDDVPPSMRGIESRPNASIMLQSAQANIDSGLYKDMNESMAAQIALNKKIPQYSFEENVRRSLASQEMVKKPYGTTAASGKQWADTLKARQTNAPALRASAGVYDPIRQGAVPGGGTNFSPTPTRKTIIAPLANRSLGRSVAARAAPFARSGGRGGRGNVGARRSASRSSGRSARNNFRGL